MPRIAAPGSERPDTAGHASSGEAETSGINLYSEHSLHDALKRIAAGPGGRIEVTVLGRVADAVRADGELVEVQTGGLAAVQEKATSWAAENRRVRVQYPVAARTLIVTIDPRSGEILSRRRSPRRRTLWDAFDALTRAPALIATPGVTLEILMVEVTEFRRLLDPPVRRGRFFRKAERVDRALDAVLESHAFSCAEDWISLLPGGAEGSWTHESLGEAAGVSSAAARTLLYSLARAGILECIGKEGRRKRYAVRGRKEQ